MTHYFLCTCSWFTIISELCTSCFRPRFTPISNTKYYCKGLSYKETRLSIFSQHLPWQNSNMGPVWVNLGNPYDPYGVGMGSTWAIFPYGHHNLSHMGHVIWVGPYQPLMDHRCKITRAPYEFTHMGLMLDVGWFIEGNTQQQLYSISVYMQSESFCQFC